MNLSETFRFYIGVISTFARMKLVRYVWACPSHICLVMILFFFFYWPPSNSICTHTPPSRRPIRKINKYILLYEKVVNGDTKGSIYRAPKRTPHPPTTLIWLSYCTHTHTQTYTKFSSYIKPVKVEYVFFFVFCYFSGLVSSWGERERKRL